MRHRWMPRPGHACATVRETAELTRLFNPRIDAWNQHFRIQAGHIIGLTPVGKTTVYVLNMNRPERVRVLLELEPETFLG
jgi:hypothetical protein